MATIIGYLAVAISLLGMVSCSNTNTEDITASEEVTSTFTITLAELDTRAAGTAELVNSVVYGVYDVSNGGRLLPDISSSASFVDGKAEVNITLATGKKYDLVFFAYCDKTSAYTIDWDKRILSVNYKNSAGDNDLANLETRDAFFHVEQDFVAGPDKTFYLKRPFAQLNAGQSYEDYEYMQGKKIIKSSMKSYAYSQMSLARDTYGDVIGSKVAVEMALNSVVDIDTPAGNDDLVVVLPTGVENEYAPVPFKHLSMNYLLIKDYELVNVEFMFLGDEGTEFTRTYPSVPLQRNYRTNIIGNLISAPMEFQIIVNPIFDNDHPYIP